LLGEQRGNEKTEALMREFWSDAKTQELRREAMQLRDATKFGDPLYLARTLGRGRVTVMLTTAGEQWSDWPTGPGRPSFVPVMVELERYLSGGGADANPVVGQPIEFRVDESRYKPSVARSFVTFDPQPTAVGGATVDPTPVTDLQEQQMLAEDRCLVFKFADAINPGAYLFTLTNLKPSAGGSIGEVPEYRAVAVNLDTPREGDLRRAGRDDLTRVGPNVGIHSPRDEGWLEELKDKASDLSESSWLYVIFLLTLIAEQAMAVRLSYTAPLAGDLSGFAGSTTRNRAFSTLDKA
jgi:hypothetical protein